MTDQRQDRDRVVGREMETVAVDTRLFQCLTAEFLRAPRTQRICDMYLYSSADIDAIDTVATVLVRFVHFLIRAGLGDGHALPVERTALFQHPLLFVHKRGIDIHYIHVDTVHTRIGHTDRVIDDRVTANLDCPFVQLDLKRVFRTDLVVLLLNNAVGTLSTYY